MRLNKIIIYGVCLIINIIILKIRIDWQQSRVDGLIYILIWYLFYMKYSFAPLLSLRQAFIPVK
jgi:hypothetical protein